MEAWCRSSAANIMCSLTASMRCTSKLGSVLNKWLSVSSLSSVFRSLLCKSAWNQNIFYTSIKQWHTLWHLYPWLVYKIVCCFWGTCSEKSFLISRSSIFFLIWYNLNPLTSYGVCRTSCICQHRQLLHGCGRIILCCCQEVYSGCRKVFC